MRKVISDSEDSDFLFLQDLANSGMNLILYCATVSCASIRAVQSHRKSWFRRIMYGV